MHIKLPIGAAKGRSMKHVKPISRRPLPAQEGQTTLLETAIIILLTAIFQDWDNFVPVIQNLQKFYSKTPA